LIEAAGGTARVVETDGHPAVIGRIEGAGPTLLRYGMYDVQPVDEPGWESPPFGAEIRDLKDVGPAVVARGAANSKACLAAFIRAVGEARRRSELPVTVTFLIDGEEELGSRNLPGVVESNRPELEADAGFDLDLHADISGTPDVYLGCKGVVSIMLRCKGGEWGGPMGRDLHSSNGAIVHSPAWSIARALDALVGPDEELRFQIDAPPPPLDDEPYVVQLASGFRMKEELEERYAVRFKSDDPREIVEALMYRPALNINGLEGGAPQGSKTIIPHVAKAALDLRFPYGSDIEALHRTIVDTVHGAAPEVEVDIYEVCPPARTSPTSAVAKAMIRSHSDVGPDARVWPTSPWWAPYYLFERTLGIPFAHGGAGHSSGAHGANEYASVEGLRAHMKQSIAFLYRFAAEFGS
jgi:acetylornithine deacetylase/succinyl-diaminopimelate desuccinylase-like protein